jgi:hypothetical protein
VPADYGFGFHQDLDVRPAGPTPPGMVQKSLSREFKLGRGRFRFSTATWRRRARTSRAVSLRLRKIIGFSLQTAIDRDRSPWSEVANLGTEISCPECRPSATFAQVAPPAPATTNVAQPVTR